MEFFIGIVFGMLIMVGINKYKASNVKPTFDPKPTVIEDKTGQYPKDMPDQYKK